MDQLSCVTAQAKPFSQRAAAQDLNKCIILQTQSLYDSFEGRPNTRYRLWRQQTWKQLLRLTLKQEPTRVSTQQSAQHPTTTRACSLETVDTLWEYFCSSREKRWAGLALAALGIVPKEQR